MVSTIYTVVNTKSGSVVRRGISGGKKYFLRLHTNNSVYRNDGAEKESCGQESCGQQASGMLRLLLLDSVRHLGVHHLLGRDEGEHCVQVQGMYGGGEKWKTSGR